MAGRSRLVVGHCMLVLPLLAALGCSGTSGENFGATGGRVGRWGFTLRVGCQKSSLLLNLLRATDVCRNGLAQA